jgi:1,4-alpha-glucan branching enzyme
MGWMHDTLEMFQTEPGLRPGNYHKLTFSMMYFGREHYLMPLSHDENVHGKATIAQKMSGDYEGKFAQARALYLYMFAHPGKKLNFMGGEFAQLREWDENREQDWFMLQYPNHDAFWRFFRELGHVYRDQPALWEQDYAEAGFTWRVVQADQDVVYAFERISSKGERVLCVLNLSWQGHADYEIQIPDATEGTVLIDSDWWRYGGTTPDDAVKPIPIKDGVLRVDLPTCSGKLIKLA